MQVTVERLTDWKLVMECARNTVHLQANDKEPTEEWKSKMLKAEHSPIRALMYKVKITECPHYVMTHLTRHKIGVEWYVATSRPDRQKESTSRHEQRKDDPCDIMLIINAQALMAISQKRLCYQAEKGTREVWRAVVDALRDVDAVVAEHCVKPCEKYLHCYEMKPCGWVNNPNCIKEFLKYNNRMFDNKDISITL